MTPRYTVQPLYRVIDSTTGEPVGDPCPQSDAEVTATALNAAEAAKDNPRRWLFEYDPRGGDHLSIYGNAILSGPGTARELHITPGLVEELAQAYGC